MVRAFALLLLSACAATQSVSMGKSDRVRLLAKIDDAAGDGRINTYYPSVDYRSGLALRVVRVVEGTFPHDFVVCAAHSGALMKFFLLMEIQEDSLVFRKDALLELSLVWDGRQRLYRLDEHRIVER